MSAAAVGALGALDVADIYGRGRTRFMGIELLVAAGALVPRAETELLGNTAADLLAAMEVRGERELRVIDMCCGSGNLACGIAHRVSQARIWATDLTDGCVLVARRNVQHLELAGRVEVRQGDLFGGLGGLGLEESVDAVVCNPPYISNKRLAGDRAGLLAHEPREAFDGGPYGLSIHQRVIREATSFLRPGGVLLFEIGLGQERQLELLFRRNSAYEGLTRVSDAAGAVRVIMATRTIA